MFRFYVREEKYVTLWRHIHDEIFCFWKKNLLVYNPLASKPLPVPVGRYIGIKTSQSYRFANIM